MNGLKNIFFVILLFVLLADFVQPAELKGILDVQVEGEQGLRDVKHEKLITEPSHGSNLNRSKGGTPQRTTTG